MSEVVMITGAAGHLAGAVADAFRARGARLVLLARRAADIGMTGADVLPLGADLLDRGSVIAAVDAARQRFGSIDVLCNIAGGFRMGPRVHEAEPRDIDFLLDVNVRTLLNAVHAVVPHMLAQQRGKIVNVAAFAAQRGAAGMGVYAAAKSAVVRLTEAMAAELRAANINVNCVLPTIIDTPENRAAMPDADPARWVAPADLARVIVFLASADARAVHGAALPVSGLS